MGFFNQIRSQWKLVLKCLSFFRRGFFLSNGHSPQICHNGELLVRMCRGESHFSQKSPLANVGESGESGQSRLANVDEWIESGESWLVNVGKFMESNQFSKRTILASTRNCQKWQIFGEYLNSTNSLASGHCLFFLQNRS
jgi:hypothetical protein